MRWWLGIFLVWPVASATAQSLDRYPVIDVHLHSRSLDALTAQGPNPVTGMQPPTSVDEHMRQTLTMMERYNIVLGIVSGGSRDARVFEGPLEFRKLAPDRIWASPSLGQPGLNLQELRSLYEAGELLAMGEITAQYEGYSVSDSILDPYFALAESLDIPVGIHMGIANPGITKASPNFRVRLGSPILLEELLNRRPNLRVWIMHAGAPFLAETLAILGVYPQVYVDIAVINWIRPRSEFYSYLKSLIDSGYGDRIMFGSDQMSWPDAIGLAVEAIKAADFLSEEQKRAILYDNAVRFLRLSTEVQARHHAMVQAREPE